MDSIAAKDSQIKELLSETQDKFIQEFETNRITNKNTKIDLTKETSRINLSDHNISDDNFIPHLNEQKYSFMIIHYPRYYQ